MTYTQLPTPKAEVSTQRLLKGETLFYQGDHTAAIFIVITGRIRLLRHLADGNAIPLYFANDGETFSEAALFSDVYHCDAIAEKNTEIEIHPKKALLDAFAVNPDLAMTFMAHLARQVINLRSRLEIRNIRSAEERVIQFLKLEISDPGNSITFASPLKDIAASIGLSHEAFYRVLSTLEREGKIVREGRKIGLVG